MTALRGVVFAVAFHIFTEGVVGRSMAKALLEPTTSCQPQSLSSPASDWASCAPHTSARRTSPSSRGPGTSWT
jgi:hypothetical protein